MTSWPEAHAYAQQGDRDDDTAPESLPLESWRAVWRRGIAPTLPTAGLKALEVALATDDKALVQGATTTPPPLMCVADYQCEAGCAIAYCGWKGLALRTVEEVDRYYQETLHKADQALKQPAGSRWFLNWFDDRPRGEMRRDLLAEVRRELRYRLPPDGVIDERCDNY
jgi:hypothetical protein